LDIDRAFPGVTAFLPEVQARPEDADFNPLLMDLVFTRERAVVVAVAFLKTGRGEATFRELSDEHRGNLLEEDEPKLHDKKIVVADLMLHYPDGKGFSGWWSYVFEPRTNDQVRDPQAH